MDAVGWHGLDALITAAIRLNDGDPHHASAGGRKTLSVDPNFPDGRLLTCILR
jgi:hypothetical protein